MSRRHPLTRQALSVSATFLVASGLGFVLLGLVARWLTPEDNARFLAIWGLIFGLGSALSAVEQTVSRRSAHADMEGRKVPLGVVQSALLAWLLSVAAVAVLMMTPAARNFVSSGAVGLLVLVALFGFSGQFLARGVFLGTQQIGRFLTVLLLEAGARTAMVVGLIAAGVGADVELAVVAIVVGCFGWVPLVARLVPRIDWRGTRDGWGRAFGTVAALGVANTLIALMVTGYPALVGVVVGDVSSLADLFGVVTLSRVPLVLLAPLTTMAVPLVTRLVVAGRAASLRGLLVRIAACGAAAAVVLGCAGYAFGPWAMRVFMGPSYDPPGFMVAVVLAATCVLGAALIQTAALVALGKVWRLAAVWLAGDLVAVLVMMLLPAHAEIAAMWGFAFAVVVAQLGTAGLVWRTAGRTTTLVG